MCVAGHLEIEPGTLKHEQTAASRADNTHSSHEEGREEHRFVALLVCSARHCREPVAVAGDVSFVVARDDEGNETGFQPKFKPTYLSPAPRIFRAPRSCPKEITDELDAAFKAFWFDSSASGNRIRGVVELLLTHLDVRRFVNGGGKRHQLALHKRLEHLDRKQPDLARALFAVKWIGNAGSHPGEAPLDRGDLFDGFDLLHYALTEVFEHAVHAKAVKSLARHIVRRRKPRSR